MNYTYESNKLEIMAGTNNVNQLINIYLPNDTTAELTSGNAQIIEEKSKYLTLKTSSNLSENDSIYLTIH